MREYQSTKFRPPRTNSNLIIRSRLISRLNSNAKIALSLICAPAGYGKTTLAAQWAAQAALPACWVTVDGTERSAADFVAGIIAAVRLHIPGFAPDLGARLGLTPEDAAGTSLPPSRSNDDLSLDELQLQFYRSIDELSTSFALIIDDYNKVADDSIHELIDSLLLNPVDALNIVIASRTVPPFPLSQLRTRGLVDEVYYDDLRFSQVETEQFIGDTPGTDLSHDQIFTLQSRTEGWIAGLRLATITIQNSTDHRVSVETFNGTNRYVMAYFRDEVFDPLPEDVRRFLTRTSILDQMNPGLCEYVVESACLPILNDLERNNLFTIRIDADGKQFRYHTLFREMLQYRLEMDSPEDLAPLHTRACRWLVEHGNVTAAVGHAIIVRDWDMAVKLLEPVGGAAVVQFQPLLAWIRALPEDRLRAEPILSLWHAWALLYSGHVRAAERALDLAELSSQANGHTSHSGELTYLRSRIARCRGEGAGAVALGEQALNTLSGQASTLRVFATVSICDGLLLQGVPEKAEAASREAYDMALRMEPRDDCLTGMTVAFLARCQANQGRLNDAWATLQEGLDISNRSRHEMPLHLPLFGAEILILRNGLREAEQSLNRALLRIRRQNVHLEKTLVWMLLAQVAWAQGNATEAQAMLDHTITWCRRNGNLNYLRQAEAQRAWIWMSQRELTAVEAWLEKSATHPGSDIAYEQESSYRVLARYLRHKSHEPADSGRPDNSMSKAIDVLRRLEEQARLAHRDGDAAESQVQLALAYADAGDTAASVVHLERAVAYAVPEGAVGMFVREGADMRRLLETARDRVAATPADGERRPIRSQIEVLLSAFDHGSPTPGKPQAPQVARLLELSQREQEILRYIAAGLTNTAIADRLFVSINTVKTHLKHIFTKLDVESRAQAVAYAMSLGLL